MHAQRISSVAPEICRLVLIDYLRSMILKLVSEPQIMFEGKAQVEEKAEHTR
jgi:hypothetical protein